MISGSKTTFSLNNLKILRPKVTKNLMNMHKKFCKYPHHDFLKAREQSAVKLDFNGSDWITTYFK